MPDLENVQTAAAGADAAVAALESRAAEIQLAIVEATQEHDEAIAAIARSVADGADGKSRSALISAEQKAAAIVGALAVGRDEVSARLVHARQHQMEARQALNEAEERAAYAASSAALAVFTEKFTEALGKLIAEVDRRVLSNVLNRVCKATTRAPDVRQVAEELKELAGDWRLRAGLERSTFVAVKRGPPHPVDTGIYALRDLLFKDADDTTHEIPAGFVGNVAAEVARRAVAAEAAQALRPRPNFRTVRMVRDFVEESGDSIRKFENGRLLSVAEPIAESLLARGVADRCDLLVAEDVDHWSLRRGYDLPPPVASSNKRFAIPLDLGRLDPINPESKEFA